MTQYVCHISGQGEKWALHHDYTQANSHPEATAYVVENKTPGYAALRLPRCEYRLCEPPEVWVDVTAECDLTNDPDYQRIRHDDDTRFLTAWQGRGYRLRKVSLGDLSDSSFSHAKTVFIVEKRR